MPHIIVLLDMPPPPHCPTWCRAKIALISSHQRKDHRATQLQIEYIILLLTERYIMQLSYLPYHKCDAEDKRPPHLEWLTYIWAAKILVWTKRRRDETTWLFSIEFSRIIYEVVYPFQKIEREETSINNNSSGFVVAPPSARTTFLLTTAVVTNFKVASLLSINLVEWQKILAS